MMGLLIKLLYMSVKLSSAQ